jgi:CBS domain-containing protein
MNKTIPHINAPTPAFVRAHVADAMTLGVITCSPDTPLRVVARKMSLHGVHAIFVFDYGLEMDENVELWGIVSDLDVVAAASGDLDELTAKQSSVTPLVSITSDDLLEHAAQRMAETGVSHLVVLDPVAQRPVGVLSTLDIVRYVSEDPEARDSTSTF